MRITLRAALNQFSATYIASTNGSHPQRLSDKKKPKKIQSWTSHSNKQGMPHGLHKSLSISILTLK